MSKFRITPIGTCRIHTPLARAEARYPIELDLRRNYGFVHSSDEALQQLRFLQGEKEFRPEVGPLVLRGGSAAPVEAQSWEPSDFHIVEISSSKKITSGPDSVQVNYVYRHFADFFANAERARQYWTLVRKGHRGELLGFLKGQTSYSALSRADRELLVGLTVEQQSFKSVKQDMAEIVERLGNDKVLFVTHINGLTPDEQVIPSRDRLIRWVKLAAEQLDANVFDPTELLADFGQELALENGGLDLTHFTLAFSDRVYDAIHSDHIAPRMGSAIEGGPEDRNRHMAILAASLENMLDQGDFFAASRDLFAALEQSPDAAPLVRLRGLVRSRIGDFRGALDDLRSAGSENLSLPMRVWLLEALSATENYEEALDLAERLIEAEEESSQVYRLAVNAAEATQKWKRAIGYAKQAFRRDRSDLATALHALVLLFQHGGEVEISEWRREIIDNIGASTSGAFELCLWAVRHADEELFAATIGSVAKSDKGGSIDLVEEAFNAGLWNAVATGIPYLVDLGRLSRTLAERRSALIGSALDQAQALADSREVAAASSLAQALSELAEKSNRQVATARFASRARLILRQLSSEARHAIRAAYSDEDWRQVVELGNAAGDVVRNHPASAVLVARSLHALGETQSALDVLQSVSTESATNFHVRWWTARLAVQARDYATALKMYGSLRESSDPKIEDIRPEIARFFDTIEARALRQLRELAQAERTKEALAVADTITTYLGPLERVDRELSRLHSMLRGQLRQIDEGDRPIEDREHILRQMLKIRHDDPAFSRRLALELMRQFRFAEAAELWEQILVIEPDNESAERNLARCTALAQRRMSALAPVVEAAA